MDCMEATVRKCGPERILVLEWGFVAVPASETSGALQIGGARFHRLELAGGFFPSAL